ncbi:MAG: glycosyltransferase [Chitinispirillaceae bacterium]|nr:glycosyltransferase [Chitinispirillaceae bacterium]
MRTNKVCIISKYVYPDDTRLCQQIKVLNRFNVSCDVLCLKRIEQENFESLSNIRIFRINRIKLIKKNLFNYLIDTLTFMITAFTKLCFLSIKNSYRIIVVHTLPEFIVLTAFFHKLSGSAIVLDGRDLSVDLIGSRWPGYINRILKQIAILVEKIVVKTCDEIITASSGFKKSLLLRGVPEEKLTVLLNTADEVIFKYVENHENEIISEKASLIYHGTVSERFGIIIAVKAMDLILRQIPFSVLHIYGMYNLRYRNTIERLIQKLNLENSVILHEAVPQKNIYEHIITMDIGVVPYMNDHFMNIALSTKTFEYVASGLPVVASRLRSTKELFNDDCIWYTEPENPADLAKKVIEVCLDPVARAYKRTCAFNIFKKYYTSEIQHRNYMNIINYYMDNEYNIPGNTKKKDLVDSYTQQ